MKFQLEVHRGKKEQGRDKIIYANLKNENGELLVSATLDYVMIAIKQYMRDNAEK